MQNIKKNKTLGPPHNVYLFVRVGNAKLGIELICISLHYNISYDTLYAHYNHLAELPLYQYALIL